MAVTPQAVCGAPDASAVGLASRPPSPTVTTSDGEREPLPVRQPNRRLTRKPTGLSKALPGREKPLGLALA